MIQYVYMHVYIYVYVCTCICIPSALNKLNSKDFITYFYPWKMLFCCGKRLNYMVAESILGQAASCGTFSGSPFPYVNM